MDNSPTDVAQCLAFQFPSITWNESNIAQYFTVIAVPETSPKANYLTAVLDNATTKTCVRRKQLLKNVREVSGVTQGSAGSAPITVAGDLECTLHFGDQWRFGITAPAICLPTLPPGVDILLAISDLLKGKQLMCSLQRETSPVLWLSFFQGEHDVSPTFQLPHTDKLFKVYASPGLPAGHNKHAVFISVSDSLLTPVVTFHTSTTCDIVLTNWIQQTAGLSPEEFALMVHRIMGHAGTRPVKNLHIATIGLPNEIKLPDAITKSCETCLQAKLVRAPVKAFHLPRSMRPGDLINADIQQVSPLGHGGKKMRLNYVCDFSGTICTFALKSKSDAARSLPKLNTTYGHSIREIMTDGGGEFQGSWETQATKLGIGFHHGPRDASIACNPKAERAHLTIDNCTNAFLRHAGFTGHLHKLWPYVDQQSALVHSFIPQERFGYKYTPFERLYNTKPDISMINIVGARCYVVNNTRQNGEYKGIIAYLLHDEPRAGTKVMYYPKSQSVIRSKDVIVDNRHLYKDDYVGNKPKLDLTEVFQPIADMKFFSLDSDVPDATSYETSAPDSKRKTTRKRAPPARFDPAEEAKRPQWSKPSNSPRQAEPENSGKAPVSSSKQSTSSFNVQCFLVFLACQQLCSVYLASDTPWENVVLFNQPKTKVVNQIPPKSAKQAWDDPDWRDAMLLEYNALFKQGVVQPCAKDEVPSETKIYNVIWVFTIKDDGTYKARIVANGSRQPNGDYYSPTIPTSLVRILLGLAAARDYDVATADVSRAFLNAELPSCHYIHVPQCMPGAGKQVLRVTKALYGFREAPKLWNRTVTEFLSKQGLTQSKTNPCLFFGDDIYLVFHVDDFLFVGNSDKVSALIDDLFERFPGNRTDLDDEGHPKPNKKFLKLNIRVTDDEISLSAEDAITNAVTSADLPNMYQKHVPMSLHMLERVATATSDPSFTLALQVLVGALLYIATVARPDVMFAVAFLARYTHLASQTALDAARDVLRYLNSTKDAAITFPRKKSAGYLNFDVFVDAGSQCRYTGRWTSGFELFLDQVPIHWQSKRQNLCALSSCEAELVAMAAATVETLFYRRILLEMKLISDSPTPVYCDNSSAIALVTKEFIQSGRSKHIDIKHFFTREQHRDFKTVQVLYVPTAANKADGMTKPLARTKHAQFREFLFKRIRKQDQTKHAISPRVILSAVHRTSKILQTGKPGSNLS